MATWGDDGPPEEAYSRVSRDLVAVTARFAEYLDDLPARLTREYRCRLRALTPDESSRLLRLGLSLDHSYAVEPEAPDCASLLVGRTTFEGGAAAVLAFGRVSNALVPDCFCDACDEDSDSLIQQADDFLRVAVSESTEFRRPYRPEPGIQLDDGPWMEEGYQSPTGAASHASADVRGGSFSQEWRAWPVRE